MYSYEKHTRNQHPYFHGHTLRVRNESTDAPPELSKAREQVISACKRAGSLFVHWRRFTPEFNPGRLCPHMNSRTKTGNNAECPICYGTGFTGGYAPPVIQYMIVQHSNRRLEATSTGFIRLNEAKSQSPYLPNINPADVIGEIKNFEGKLDVVDRYIVEDDVEKIRFRLADNFEQANELSHMVAESDVVSYEFQASRIYRHTDPEKRNIKYSIPFDDPIWLADPNEIWGEGEGVEWRK